MALSNYEDFTLTNSDSPNGSLKIESTGVWIDVYKNWLYLHDTNYTSNVRGYNTNYYDHVVGEVQSGVMRYKGLRIISARYDNLICFYAYHYNGQEIYWLAGAANYNHYCDGDPDSEYSWRYGITDVEINKFIEFIHNPPQGSHIKAEEVMEKLKDSTIFEVWNRDGKILIPEKTGE